VERQPLLEGKQMSLVMTSTHKPKTQKREDEQGGEESEPEAVPAVEAPAAQPAPVAAATPKPAAASAAKSAGA